MTLFDRILHRRHLRHWERAAAAGQDMATEDLRTARSRAQQLRHRLDRALHVAEGQLAGGARDLRALDPMADWVWRPDLWNGPVAPHGLTNFATGAAFGDHSKVFHDCPICELALRQMRNEGAAGVAPFGVRLEVFRFEGTFVSLAIELPEDAVSGLTRRNVVNLGSVIDVEKPVEAFGRLSLRQGPNTRRIVREIDMRDRSAVTEFDIGYSEATDQPVANAWLELIFDVPTMNEISLTDMFLSRRPRAEL
ncbi:MAG: DUF6478 family protein [Pseudomonadota bacterium]